MKFPLKVSFNTLTTLNTPTTPTTLTSPTIPTTPTTPTIQITPKTLTTTTTPVVMFLLNIKNNDLLKFYVFKRLSGPSFNFFRYKKGGERNSTNIL